MRILTVLEQVVLTAVLVLKAEAYGVSISRKVKELCGKTVMYGSLYNVLDQLHKKGYVAKQVKTPLPGEGGHERILYTVTGYGFKALEEARALHASLWANIPAFARKR